MVSCARPTPTQDRSYIHAMGGAPWEKGASRRAQGWVGEKSAHV